MEPKVRLFAEPASALDPEVIGEVLEEGPPGQFFTQPWQERLQAFLAKILSRGCQPWRR